MFNKLVELQYEKYPEQKSTMKKFITKNFNHINNQNRSEYKCCCSMKDTISMK